MINHKAYVKPKHGNWINQQEYIAIKSVVADAAPQTTDTSALDAQIVLLQAQVVQLTSQITTLNSQITALQVQAAVDAATIAQLQGQVTALTAQVATLNNQITALQNQLIAYTKYKTYFAGQITLVGGGIYVPPAWDNPIISISRVTMPLKMGQYTTVGGAYP